MGGASMTLKDYHKFTLGTSDHLTRCRVLWGGGEIMNDYFSRLGDFGQNIKIRSARYDAKHDILTAYASDKGFIEYRNAMRHWQHNEGRFHKNGFKKQGF